MLLASLLACNTLLPPRPAIAWDTSASALIVEANTGGGMLYEPNALPDARLWGDGRLVWVAYDGTGGRAVLTATLTPAEMQAALKDIVDAAFFDWDDHYSPGVVYDAPSTCLRVWLASDSQSVCETVSGAPRAFGRLYSHLAQGAGHAASATPFVPERGFLSLTPLGASLPHGAAATAEWPTSLGLPLDAIASSPGQWLTGEALAFAWNTTNRQPLYPILHDGNAYYQAQLRVPGVTTLQPDER